MSHELRSDLRGWGAVTGPDGESIPVEDDTVTVDDVETARWLASEYDALSPVDNLGDAEDEDDADAGEETPPVGEHADAFDAEAFLDRTPMQRVIDDIEAGMVDDSLGEVLIQSTRAGVKDAAAARAREIDADIDRDTDREV